MEVDWNNWTPSVRANLLFVIQDKKILLIRKKTGFGAGNINGPGGKLEPGETALEAALREVEEEISIQAHNPEDMGELLFQFVDGLRMHVQVFRSNSFDGTPTDLVFDRRNPFRGNVGRRPLLAQRNDRRKALLRPLRLRRKKDALQRRSMDHT